MSHMRHKNDFITSRIMCKMAHLTVILGPMFSGKTSRLCFELNRYADIGMKVLYINSTQDTRSDMMSSHSSGTVLNKRITTVKVESLNNIVDIINVHLYDVIGVDEASFFDDLSEIIEWVDYNEKIVIVSGLNNSFKREPFGHVVDLSRHADEVIKLNAKCHLCLKEGHVVDAPFSYRIGENKDEVLIDDTKYLALCRKHWNLKSH